jgi:hypothetical protein
MSCYVNNFISENMIVNLNKTPAPSASSVMGYRIALALVVLAFLISQFGGAHKGLEQDQIIKLLAANVVVLVPLSIGFAIAARKRGSHERAGGAMLLGLLLVIFSSAYLSHFKRPAGIMERQHLDAMDQQDNRHYERYIAFRSRLQTIDLQMHTAFAENILTAEGRASARAAIRQEREAYGMLVLLTQEEFKEWDSVDAIQMGDVPELPARRSRNAERAAGIVKANNALFLANDKLWRSLEAVYTFAEKQGATLTLRDDKWVYANDRQKDSLQALIAEVDAAFASRKELLRKALLTDADARMQRVDELDFE